jgi:general secretion pathway protein I
MPFFFRKPGRSASRAAGFTLLEVLVSMAVLAICLTVIMELFSGALKSSHLSDKYLQAVFLAREKAEEVLVSKELSEGVVEGENEAGFKWKAEVHPVLRPEEELPKLPFGTFEVRVEVMWGEGRHQRSYVLETRQIADEASDRGTSS